MPLRSATDVLASGWVLAVLVSVELTSSYGIRVHSSIRLEQIQVTSTAGSHVLSYPNLGLSPFSCKPTVEVRRIAVNSERLCESNVCLNEGECVVNDVERSFQCICKPGFTGVLCESVASICSRNCRNGGECIRVDNTEICDCRAGYFGEFCESQIKDCRDNGCRPNERCVPDSLDVYSCVLDPCASNPCFNNATCIPEKDSFTCSCPPGFEGQYCENVIDYCRKNPCLNGGTCLSSLNSFFCQCIDGYKGKLCETLERCQQRPCLNGGTCIETVDSYNCHCPPDFSGKNCQHRSELACNCTSKYHLCIDGKCVCSNGLLGDNCDQQFEDGICNEHKLCLNGGFCAENGSCICTPEYTGKFCEQSLKKCLVNNKPCLNGRCMQKYGKTYCICDTGYEGITCEKQVMEPLNPCNGYVCNNGKCYVRDGTAKCKCNAGWQGSYCDSFDVCYQNQCLNGGKCLPNKENPTEFLCMCEDSYEGDRCEILRWKSPCNQSCTQDEICDYYNDSFTCAKKPRSCGECVNSIRCVEPEGSDHVFCICQTSFDGPKCDRKLEKCGISNCSEYQVCRKKHYGDKWTTFCGCAPGFYGDYCQLTSAVTFKNTSFFIHQAQSPIIGNPSATYSLKFSFRTTMEDTHIVTAENILNQVQFTIELQAGRLIISFPSFTMSKIVMFPLNDDIWYTVVLNNTMKTILIQVSQDDVLIRKVRAPERKDLGIFWTRFGRGREGNYRGCIRDVEIGGEPIDVIKSTRSVGVIEGCQRERQCTPNPCQNNGKCVDKWDGFECECKRPYLPPYCIEKLDEVTFGNKNLSSQLQFSIDKDADDVRMHTDLSFLIRTNKPDEAVLYIGEQDLNDFGTFLSLSLISGAINVKARLGGKRTFSGSCPGHVDNNVVHLINLLRDRNNITAAINGKKCMEFEIANRFDHPLLADTIIIGSVDSAPKEAFDTVDYFKGTIQDLRINGKSLVLTEGLLGFNVTTIGGQIANTNILKGTVSDDVCSQNNICVNGRCVNTFNDFECSCEFSWTGRRCDEKDHCAMSSCGRYASCTNYKGGYTCTLPATFIKSSTAKLHLHSSGGLDVLRNNLSLSLRTRSKQGQILYLQSEENFLNLSLKNGHLVFGTVFEGQETHLELPNVVSDGLWHNLIIDQDAVYFDGDTISEVFLFDTNKVLENSRTFVVFGANGNGNYSFEGCLKDVVIGATPPISLLPADKAGGYLENITHFVVETKNKIRDDGCYSEPLCGDYNPCKNGAVCRDMWNLRICSCKPGFSGIFCQENVNECSKNKCVHGKCVDGIGKYSCDCSPGYTGPYCDKLVNYCEPNPCLNDGVCSSRNGTFYCDCPQPLLGSICQISKHSNCSSQPCRNEAVCTDLDDSFLCTCPEGFEGSLCDVKIDHCSTNPCQNGATCSSKLTGFSCECTEGYEGELCDILTDHCKTVPCVHGNCSSIWNGYICECNRGWKGPKCDIDDDECLLFPCQNGGKCQNIQGGFKCSCPKYYFGDYCEIAGTCVSNPCGDHGVCNQINPSDFSCTCMHGYTGIHCEEQIDYCSSNPCLNGATCEKLVGNFKCLCIPGFTGDTCATDIDECVEGACLNGGRCTDRINGYECDCSGTGYSGERCTDDIDECSKGLCQYGICTNLPGSYNCDCDFGYIGKRCNREDPCLPDEQNQTRHNCLHGKCVRPRVDVDSSGTENVQYDCDCFSGYTGADCTEFIERKRPLALSHIAGPVVAVLIALISIGCLLFGIVTVKGRRRVQGTYSPSNQEVNGSRLPAPPEERLI